MKLEVVVLGVSDVDRAKAFYENLGWRLDIDVAMGDDFRAVQVTPHNSGASIIFGKGVTSSKPGSAHSLVLGVDDIDTARDDLDARGVDMSEVFHYAGGPFNNAVENPLSADATLRNVPTSRFVDPDGSGWLLQEIKKRLPGREWKLTRHEPRTSRLLQSYSTRRRNTTTTTRRRTRNTTGGTGTRLT